MNNLQIFNYDGNQVRTVEVNGETWWVLKDVCDVLEIDSPHKVAARLDDDEKGRSLIPTPGGNQEMTVINESGLYNVILRSDKPQAKPFRKWVTSVVLPTIRKTGGYSVQNNNLQHFPAKSTSAGEVSSLIKNVRSIMKEQNSTSEKIARQTALLLKHFGIPIIEEFVEVSPWEQLTIKKLTPWVKKT